MRILGIETSCDETAVAIVENGTKLLSNVVVSQIDIHKEFGGVVPEVAARSHIEVIIPIIEKALKESMLSWSDIDAISVTKGPGLVGSLLIGSLTARTLSVIKKKPLYGVHHVLGHVFANFITRKSDTLDINLPADAPQFPLLALIVSGGHSQLVLFKGFLDFELLGQTRDDAIGEAFDKVAKILGLPYPGGPSISKAAEKGDPSKYTFPDAKLDNPYEFSFSGLKTAVLRRVQQHIGESPDYPSHMIPERLNEADIADYAASFQEAAIKTLVNKTLGAYREFKPRSVVIAGGVAANSRLREMMRQTLPITIEYAPMELCTDNAAMIASLAYFQSLKVDSDDPFYLKVQPSLSINQAIL